MKLSKILSLKTVKTLYHTAKDFGAKNAPVILTATVVVGVVVTAIGAAKGGIKAHEAMKRYREDIKDAAGDEELRKEVTKDCVKEVTIAVLPPVVTGIATIAGALALNKEVTKAKMATKAIASALAITQTSLEKSEERLKSLKDTMKEKLGVQKAHDIENADVVKRANVANGIDISRTVGGLVPCVDLWHDNRIVFYTTRTKLERGLLKAAEECRRDDWISIANIYYDLECMDHVPASLNEVGFTSSRLVDGQLPITITSFLHEDTGIPCLAIDYEPEPFR